MGAYRSSPSDDSRPSPAELQQLAIAVGAPNGDVLLIGLDNEQDGFTSIYDFDWSARCGAIIVGDKFLALDADADTKPESPSYVRRLHDRLAHRGFRPVLIESGRPGHLHLWCKITDQLFLYGLECEARQHGCDVRRGQRMRPPGSCHRSGLPVAIIGQSLEEALDALAATSLPVVALTKRTENLIRFGDTSGRYKSTSELFWAITWGAAAKGADLEWLKVVMLNPDNRGGEKLDHAKNARVAIRYIEGEYKRALKKGVGDRSKASRVRADVLAKLDLIELRVDSFPNLTPATRAVWLARIECARNAGSLTHRVGKRAVRRRAGLASTSTVNLADEKLVSIGAMIAHARGRANNPSEYELFLPFQKGSKSNRYPSPFGCEDSVRLRSLSPDSDTWRTGALGKTAWRICRILAVGPLDVDALAGRLGHATTKGLRVRLRALERDGIVAADAGGRWRFIATEFELTACELGASGDGERQLARDLSDAADDRLRVAIAKARKTATGTVQHCGSVVIARPDAAFLDASARASRISVSCLSAAVADPSKCAGYRHWNRAGLPLPPPAGAPRAPTACSGLSGPSAKP